jgi:integrase
VQVYVAGVRDSTTKPTRQEAARSRQEAARWALEREAELKGTKLPDKLFLDALQRYAKEEAPKRAGARWETIRLKRLESYPIAKRRLAALFGNDFADWRDARNKQVKPASTAREMNLMRAVLECARRDWKWIKTNPMHEVRWPTTPKGRARRLTQVEIDDLVAVFGISDRLRADTAIQRVGLAFLFALETAMRSGEICALTWPNVHLKEQYVHLPKPRMATPAMCRPPVALSRY